MSKYIIAVACYGPPLWARASKDKIMLLQVKRTHFEAIKAERKRWEGRPLF